MNFFKAFLHFFVTITTAIVFVVAIDGAIGDYEMIPKYTMFQILGAGAATALVTTAVFSYEPKTRKQYLIQTVVHYIVLCGIMAVAGIMFGWIDVTAFDVIIMCIYVAVVYFIVFVISYLLLKKEVDRFNEAINRRRNGK